MKITPDIPVILASTSPRRVSLMEQVHLNVEVCMPQADETPKKGEKPGLLVKRLAREKAESICRTAPQRHKTYLVLAADTIVVAPDGRTILGKPKDPKQAVQMVQLLSGKTHTVFTGYCILLVTQSGIQRHHVRLVRSRVKMRTLSRKMIQNYVQTGEPLDKAGAYGAQGLGTALIESIKGSYTNVVGLPMEQVLSDMEKIFKVPLFSWIS